MMNKIFRKFSCSIIASSILNNFSQNLKFNFSTKLNKNTNANVSTDVDTAFKNLYSNFKESFNKISEENEQKTISDLQKILSKEQILNLEILADKFGDFSEFQLMYFNHILEEHLVNNKKLSYIDTNTDLVGLIELEKKYPEIDLNVSVSYFKQQEFMANFTDWLSKQPKPELGLVSAIATPAPVEKKEEKKVEVKKVEEKKEKSIYDIELTSFDAAKKVSLIKEVRAYTNLGLKESKELVEKAPVLILKGIKKEDTEAIVKKLSDNGGKITLK